MDRLTLVNRRSTSLDPDTRRHDIVLQVLRHTDRRLRQVSSGDVHGMCAAIRRAAEAMGPVDGFYVGFYAADHVLYLPYVYADGHDRGADTSRYGKNGLSAWVRASAKPYRFGDDGGRLIHKGAPMGEDRASADAIAVPMFDLGGSQVIGMLNAQSYQEKGFDEAFATGLQWLAKALAVAMGGRSIDARRAELYGEFPELDTSRAISLVDLLDASTDRLKEVALVADDLHHVMDVHEPGSAVATSDLAARLLELGNTCRRATAELTMMALSSSGEEPRQPSAGLTARERQIADLIASEGLSNRQVARRLTISEKTVKTHVSSILHKMGVKQRAELAWVMRSGNSTPVPTEDV